MVLSVTVADPGIPAGGDVSVVRSALRKNACQNLRIRTCRKGCQWQIQGALPKGIDSFVLTYKFYEADPRWEVGAPLTGNPGSATGHVPMFPPRLDAHLHIQCS